MKIQPLTHKYRNREVVKSLLYILPTYLILSIFIIVPIFFAFYLSFNKWNLLGNIKFTGITNYKKLSV